MPFDLQKLFTEHNAYLGRSYSASLKRAGECYAFLIDHEPAYRAIEALLEPEETIEIGLHIPEHFEVHLKSINKERMTKIAEAFETHFGPVETDETELRGTMASRRLVGRKPKRTSFWQFTLSLRFVGEACTPVYEDIEVPATTQRRLVKLECPDGPAVREPGSESSALPLLKEPEEAPLEQLPPPSGDEDQPRAEGEEVR